LKKTISYEKDILFKTSIGEICSISLEHDFTVDENNLKGDFIVSGEYKSNTLSINKEAFNYKLPLVYELESNVDLATLSYDIENFEYNIQDDVLSIYIDFCVKYEEKSSEPIIPKIQEEEINQTIEKDSVIVPSNDRSVEEEIVLPKFSEIDETSKNTNDEDVRMNVEEKSIILDNTMEDDTYVTYHVHIVREGDTLESIAMKYNVPVELIKEYNHFEALELKSKLIIPAADDE